MQTPPNQKIDVAQEIKTNPKAVVIDQNDPVMQAKVKEFIDAAGGPPETGPAKPTVAPSADFTASPLNLEMNQGFVENEKVEVDMLEISEFLKVLLQDDPGLPVRFKIKLFGGKLVLSMRSRTIFEQKRIFNILDLNRMRGMFRIKAENGEETSEDPASALMRFQQYSMALMVEAINGKAFSDLVLDGTQTLIADAALLDAFVDKHIADMGNVRWTAMMNGMRQFEGKLAKLSTEANNSDFWKPRD